MEATSGNFNGDTMRHTSDMLPHSNMEYVDRPFDDQTSASPASRPAILVVDDEKSVCSIIKEYLSILGYEVITALDGEMGLRRFRDNVPTIVITDLNIGDCSGLDIARQVKRSNPSTTVILITGYSLESLEMDDCADIIDHIVGKPIDFTALASIIKSISGQ